MHTYREFTDSRAEKRFQLQTFCNKYLEQPSETTQEKIGDILWACTEDLTEHARKWGSLTLDDFKQTTTLVADILVPSGGKRIKRAKSVDFSEHVEVHTYRRDPFQIESDDDLSGSLTESCEDQTSGKENDFQSGASQDDKDKKYDTQEEKKEAVVSDKVMR